MEVSDALSSKATNEASSMSSSLLASTAGRQCGAIFCRLEQCVVVVALLGVAEAKLGPVAP